MFGPHKNGFLAMKRGELHQKFSNISLSLFDCIVYHVEACFPFTIILLYLHPVTQFYRRSAWQLFLTKQINCSLINNYTIMKLTLRYLKS